MVRVVNPRQQPAPPEAPPRRSGRRWAVALALTVVAVAGLLQARADRPPWRVEAARLRDDGTLVVVLVNRSGPVRVTDVRLRAADVTATAPAALDDEVTAAQAAGVPPAHDPGRLLAPGRHTFLLGIRPRCPRPDGADPAAAVLLDVDRAGVRRTAASALPADLPDRLACVPLTLGAGLSPVAAPAGAVGLLLTAHTVGEGGPRNLVDLRWPGYRVTGVGNVVPQVLNGAGIDETVYFDADVVPDCAAQPGAGLAAVFEDGELPVPVNPVAAARVAALRSACRS